MQNKSLVNALTKNGLKIFKFGNLFICENNGMVLDWYVQCGKVICATIRRDNDQSDGMRDYHAGRAVNTIKDAIASLLCT